MIIFLEDAKGHVISQMQSADDIDCGLGDAAAEYAIQKVCREGDQHTKLLSLLSARTRIRAISNPILTSYAVSWRAY